MKLKKAIIVFFSFSLLMIVATGCSSSTTKAGEEMKSTKEKKISIDDLSKEKTTNNITMKIVKGDYAADSGVAADQRLVLLSFEINNENYLEEVGVGAGDFQLLSDGKTYQMYGGKDNFGEVVKAKGSSEGIGAYLIPATVSKGIIKYQPANPKWPDMEKLEWSFTIK